MNMNDYRQQLNELDGKMVGLYVQRMQIAEHIGQYKKEHGLPVKDEVRERELLERLCAQAGEEYAAGLRSVYERIIEESCARQYRLMNHE